LDESSQNEYAEITRRLVQYGGVEEGSVRQEYLKRLLIARVRIILKSPNKVSAFRKWVESRVDHQDPRMNALLVYAPEGEYAKFKESRLIEVYQEVLADVGMQSAKYIGDASERYKDSDSPLEVFQRGSLDALIAMKCLDEGVDLPRAECAVFLASTGNPRQYIQRTGRLLRKYETKDYRKTSARVVDFICLPSEEYKPNFEQAEIEKSILQREIKRVSHFAALALNQGEVHAALEKVMRDLNYLDFWRKTTHLEEDDQKK
jgi:ERCC4-related helicase